MTVLFKDWGRKKLWTNFTNREQVPLNITTKMHHFYRQELQTSFLMSSWCFLFCELDWFKTVLNTTYSCQIPSIPGGGGPLFVPPKGVGVCKLHILSFEHPSVLLFLLCYIFSWIRSFYSMKLFLWYKGAEVLLLQLHIVSKLSTSLCYKLNAGIPFTGYKFIIKYLQW